MNPIDNLRDQKLLEFQYIFNLLQRFKGKLKFFDMRSSFDYDLNHLRVSLNVQDVSLQGISVLSKEKDLSRLRRYCILIGYTRETESLGLGLYDLMVSIKCKELHLVPEINEFMQTYPFLCSAYGNIKIKEFPNEIIPSFLYLGCQEHAHDKNIIEILNITHILNVTKGSPNLFSGLKYCKVHVDDSETEKISVYFHKAFDFIQSAMLENIDGAKNVVLVHCAKGVSRSATIVLMFLMRSCGFSLSEAMDFIKKNRDIIEPNEGFMSELREFERSHNQFVRSQSAAMIYLNKKRFRFL
jgi:Dual specificity phosphatase, catalytic domain